MHRSRVKGALTRRHLMGLAAGGLTAGLLPLRGWADDDEDDDKKPSSGSTSAPVLASTGLSGQRIVVAGGGMTGVMAAVAFHRSINVGHNAWPRSRRMPSRAAATASGSTSRPIAAAISASPGRPSMSALKAWSTVASFRTLSTAPA